MIQQLNRLLAIGNLFEAGVWLVFAVIFVVLAIRCSQRRRRLSVVLAVAFAAFAISDVIESQTGAWWRPVWLLVLKGGCITVFCYAAWEYRWIQAAERNVAVPKDLPPSAVQGNFLPQKRVNGTKFTPKSSSQAVTCVAILVRTVSLPG